MAAAQVQMPCVSTTDALQHMAELIRDGNISGAVDFGNQHSTPLAVAASDLITQEELGKGSESTIRAGVYLSEPVAIKKAIIRNTKDLERFRREVGMLSSLQHSNVVPLRAARAIPPAYMMLLPQYSGSLEAMLHERGWRPAWAEVLHLSLSMAAGVQAVHEAGLVHRDIKPGNVLVDASGACVLSDFGLAEHLNKLHISSTSAPSGGFHKQRVVGTLQYLAPEVLLNQFHQQPADVYALGVSMNEAATATVPFSDCTKDNPACHTILDANYSHMQLAAAVAAEQLRPTLPPGCPPGWAQLMRACWHEDPGQRPTAAHVVNALRSLAAAERITPAAPAALPEGGAVAEVSGAAAAGRCARWAGAEEEPEAPWERELLARAAERNVQPAMVCGEYADAGRRGAQCMEDRHVLAVPLRGLSRAGLLAVFDGHRGASAAEVAAAMLPDALRQVWVFSASPEAALAAAMAQCEHRILADGDAAWMDRIARMGPAAAGTRPWPGCTALAALQIGDRMVFANVGDCRAVLCRGGAAVQITRDHVADDAAELARLRAAGASLQRGPGGSWRVGAVQLQVSRSLGDGDAKREGGVIADAEIASVELRADDEFVVLASDGLWDVVCNEDAVALVHDTVKNPSMAAKRLAVEALARGATDNLTVLVCFLRDSGTLESIYSGGVQKYSPARSFYGSRTAALAALAQETAADEMFEQL
eukprot:jgi/Ulvmu1/10364/UM061_0047.1